MDLDRAILEQIADEEKARDKYFDMVSEAEAAGMHKTASILRGIAADESRHHMALQQMYQSPEFGPMREVPIGEREEHYWEVTNMVTGEIVQSGKEQESIKSAVQDAKKELRRAFQYFEDDHLVIKVFDKSPDERAGLTFEPEYSESFWVSGGPSATPPTRPLPETYGDWVNLGMDIKEKAGIDDFKTTAEVNEHLYHISKEEEDPATAQVSKRWLTEKARELGIG